MKVTYDDGVFEELVSMSAYLADIDESLAQEFLNACDSTFLFLAANPNIGSSRAFSDTRLSDIRMWRVKGYEKYLIFFVPTTAGIRILHVLHSSTDYNRAFEEE